MKKILVKIALCLVTAGLAVTARATIATFDDLADSPEGFQMPTNYAGVNWNNFWELDGANINAYYGISASGYANGVVSPNNVAYNYLGQLATIALPSGFNLGSGYFTGAFNDGLTLEVQGFRGIHMIYDETYTVNTSEPTLISLNMTDITVARFFSSGGENAGLNFGSGTQFVMDNLDITLVPEPSPWVLFLTGSVLLFPGLRFKRFHGAGRLRD